MELIRVQDSDYSKTYALYNTFPKEEFFTRIKLEE